MTLHFWSTNEEYEFPKSYNDALCGYSDYSDDPAYKEVRKVLES